MECFSVIKRKKVLILATIWVDLENIMLILKKPDTKVLNFIIPFI